MAHSSAAPLIDVLPDSHTKVSTVPAAAVETAHDISALDVVSAVLVLFGAVNWGCVAFFGNDIPGFLFGSAAPISRSLHLLIGLAAIHMIIAVFRVTWSSQTVAPLRI